MKLILIHFLILIMLLILTYGFQVEESDELLSFNGLQLLAERGEDVEDLGKRDLASAVLVEDLGGQEEEKG